MLFLYWFDVHYSILTIHWPVHPRTVCGGITRTSWFDHSKSSLAKNENSIIDREFKAASQEIPLNFSSKNGI